MEETKIDLVMAIIFSSISIVILAVFTLLFFLSFIRKKQVLLRKQEELKLNFEKTLLQTQIEIQEQTLDHISHEIHDNIGQVLSLVSLNLNIINASEPGKIRSTSNLVDTAIRDLRNLSKGLNSDRIQQLGIIDSVKNDLANLEQTGKFETSLTIGTDMFDISPENTLILYRMTQEVINNIIKHSKASKIAVEFYEDAKHLCLSVTDNGCGFEPKTISQDGIGLLNIKKRAALIQSTAEINSQPGKGTNILFKIYKGD